MKKDIIFYLTLCLVLVTGCEKVFFEPEPASDPEAIFEDIWTTFKTDYAPFEERGVNWDEQYQNFRPQVTPMTTEEELKTVIKALLSTLNDGHVSFTTPNADVFYSNKIINERIDNELFNLDLVKSRYLNDKFSENGNGLNTFGMIGNIGYWHIDAIGLNMLETEAILDFFDNSNGLIIDLRHNQGGNFTYAFSEFGRFTQQDRRVF